MNKRYQESKLSQGYAEFTAHLFVDNFAKCKSSVMEISEDNRHALKSDYESRSPKEPAVLTRWIDSTLLDSAVPEAKFLDIIMYNAEFTKQDYPNPPCRYDWCIVAVKPVEKEEPLPMQPITVMRNALGGEFGGSGHPLNKEEYLQCVAFWERFAQIK